MSAASIVALLFLTAPSILPAQEPVDSLRGRRVRLTLRDAPSDSTLVGTLQGADSLGMTLRYRRGATELVPTTRILRVEVLDGSANTMALAGAAIGAVLGYHWYMSSGDDFSYPGPSRARGVLMAAPIGALLGAWLGPSLAGVQWQPVHLHPDTRAGPRRQAPLAAPRPVDPASLRGKKVRLTLHGTSPDSTLVGRLREVDSLGMTVRISSEVTRHVRWDEILRVEISDRQPGIAAVAGMGVGAIVGVVAWTRLAPIWYTRADIETYVIFMPLGALLGAAIGAIVNNANAQWLSVYLDPTAGPGVQVGVHLTFR